jgi:hypothetical protein
MALKIERGVKSAPVRCVIYGTEGIGKSTLAAQFPNPIILDTEDGTGRIDCARVVCHDSLTLESALLDLIGDAQGFKTVVIDSADWAERQILEHLLKKASKRSIEDFGFGKGYTMLAEACSRILGLGDQLIAKGVNVVFVAHATIKRTSPPDETDGYDRYELKLTRQTGPLFKEWADLLLFCNYKTKLVEGSDGRKKATGGKVRLMYAERSAAYDAKNRYGLPAEMPMAIGELAPALKSQTLAETIAAHVAAATTVAQLGKFGDRIDALVSEDKLTAEEWSRLTDAIAARHQEIEPATEVATND